MNILLDTNVILDYLTKRNVNYINMEKNSEFLCK